MVAAFFQCAVKTVRRWWKAGDLIGYRLGPDAPLRFKREDVLALEQKRIEMARRELRG